jgi:hypothetical protein
MRWNVETAVLTVQPRLGLAIPIVEVFPNAERPADLRAWAPTDEAAVSA